MNYDSVNACNDLCKTIDDMITLIETFHLLQHVSDKEALGLAIADLVCAKKMLIMALITDGEIH